MSTDTAMRGMGRGQALLPRDTTKNSATTRLFQTRMSDAQMAEKGVAVLELPKFSILKRLFHDDDNPYDDLPILIDTNFFGEKGNDKIASVPSRDLDKRVQFEKRIAKIREISVEEDVTLVELSLQCAEQFFSGNIHLKLPSVFLVGNGNIRLVWDKGEERIGLQFLGDGRVQYVLLQQEDGQISPIMGTRQASKILRFIEQNGLRPVIIK